MPRLRARTQAENANQHTPHGLGLLETSIGQDGWIDAITVAADDESISGSARIEIGAAKGWDFAHEEPLVIQAPADRPLVVETDGSQPLIHRRIDIPTADDPRARRLSVAANQITAVDWAPNAELLARWADDDARIKALFTEESWAAMLVGVGGEEEDTQDDDTPPVIDPDQPTRAQLGDIWRVGEHVIACLDSTDRGNVELVRGLVEGAVSFVVADPPYGIDIVAADVTVGGGERYNYPFGGVKNQQGLGSANGAKPFGSKAVRGSVGAANVLPVGKYMPVIGDESTDTAVEAALLMLDLLPKVVQFWWGANNYANALPPSTCWIVWDKENTGNFADAELAWSNHGSAVRIFKHMWNGMLRASEHDRRIHPTQKPVALFLWLYEKYGKADDLILDPFLGSGPSLKAAHRMGDRRVVGFELSPHYCDHVLAWAEAAGLTCTLHTI